MTNEKENIVQFKEWLKTNDIALDMMEILHDSFSNERRVVALQKIEPKQYLFQLPLKMILTSTLAKTETLQARKLWSYQPKPKFKCSDELMAIVVHIILTQNDKDYFFYPYYNILPKNFSNFPVYWSNEYLDLLKGSDIVSEIIDRRNGFEKDYKLLCTILPEITQICDFKEFCRVRSLVGSRNFGLKIEGKKVTTLVPFADMLNHSRPPLTRWTYESQRQSFTLKSIANIEQFEEIFDSYGPKSNTEYLLFYGFVVSNNHDRLSGVCRDIVTLTFELEEEDNHLADKVHIFKSLKNKSEESKVDETFNTDFEVTKGIGAQVEGLLVYLRVKVATLRELTVFAYQNKVKPLTNDLSLQERMYFMSMFNRNTKLESFISLANEIRVLEVLKKECLEKLKGYTNTLIVNKQKLKNKEYSNYIEEMCLKFVISEQSIYQFWCTIENIVSNEFKNDANTALVEDIISRLKSLIQSNKNMFIKSYLRLLLESVVRINK